MAGKRRVLARSPGSSLGSNPGSSPGSSPGSVYRYPHLRVLARKLANPFGHSTQVSTQVQLASICDYLPVRLGRALKEVAEHNLVNDIKL